MKPTANWTRVAIALFTAGIFLVSWLTKQSIDDNGARWVSGVSSAVVLLILGYEKWGWRLPVIRRISEWMGSPDLHGTWAGQMQFERDAAGNPGTTDFYMAVTQTLSTISVRTYFKTLTTSESYSLSAELESSVPNRTRLVYTYHSEARHNQRTHNRPHDGTCILNITSMSEMEGSYFTDRPGSGEVSLRKVSSRAAKSYDEADRLKK